VYSPRRNAPGQYLKNQGFGKNQGFRKNQGSRKNQALEKRRLRRRIHFHFGVEVGDDILESGDGLLDRSNLHQFPAADWAEAILQRNDQIPPLLL
jgi:hypothetical protein